jgi:hypothetical protein
MIARQLVATGMFQAEEEMGAAHRPDVYQRYDQAFPFLLPTSLHCLPNAGKAL